MVVTSEKFDSGNLSAAIFILERDHFGICLSPIQRVAYGYRKKNRIGLSSIQRVAYGYRTLGLYEYDCTIVSKRIKISCCNGCMFTGHCMQCQNALILSNKPCSVRYACADGNVLHKKTCTYAFYLLQICLIML